MTQEDKQFLEDNKFHYDLYVRAEIVKHLDDRTKQGLADVIHRNFDSGYPVSLWCRECIVNMLKFAYEQYEQWQLKQSV